MARNNALPNPVVHADHSYSIMNAFIVFGMALTISSSEMDMAGKAIEHAFTTLALTNDYFSWQKEYDEFCQNGEVGSIANAIWIITKEQSVSTDDATSICVDMIRSSCHKFCDEKERVEASSGHGVSVDLLKYLGALETSISGNVIWSQHTERYNFKKANGPVEPLQPPLAALTICSSCGSSTGTAPTPKTPDLETSLRTSPNDVQESLNIHLPELSDAVRNGESHTSVTSQF